jgi:hypothetical protein
MLLLGKNAIVSMSAETRTTDILPGKRHDRFVPISEVAASLITIHTTPA